MRFSLKTFGLTLLCFWPILYSQPVWACAVCFGDPNSASSKALKAAVLFLLVVVVFVLGAIGSVSWVWTRRARKIEKNL